MGWLSIKLIRLNYRLRSAFKKQHTPTTDEFSTLPARWQLQWFSRNIEDYEMRLYGDGYIGCSYSISTGDLERYLASPLDYGVSNLISAQNQEISGKRLEEIDQGAQLTEKEIDALTRAIAEDDVEGWALHSGFDVTLADGVSFALFEGYGEGQGGPRYQFQNWFKTKESVSSPLNSPIDFWFL
jgi:hypothetical protein